MTNQTLQTHHKSRMANGALVTGVLLVAFILIGLGIGIGTWTGTSKPPSPTVPMDGGVEQ